MSQISPAVERRILAALDDAAAAVADGDTPTAAVVKAATDHGLAAGHARLLSQAYNVGVTNSIRKAAADPRGRAAVVPLVDAAAVLEEMFPSAVDAPAASHAKTAMATAYRRPPPAALSRSAVAFPSPLTKAAGCEAPPVRVSSDKVVRLVRAAERECDRLWSATAGGREKLAAALRDLDEYCRRPDARPLGPVAVAAAMKYGADGAAVVAAVQSPVKKAAAQSPPPGLVDWSRPPFSFVAAAVTGGREWAAARLKATAFDAEAGVKLAVLVDAVRPSRAAPSVLDGVVPPVVELTVDAAARRLMGIDKTAGPSTDAAKGLAAMSVVQRVFEGMPETDSAEMAKQRAFNKLTDPVHEARLDTLRRKFMLTNLMANDPVIRGHRPDDVLHAYNQLASLAPRAANQEMLVQAILRRNLAQGQVDPHEVDQLAGIEGKLKQIGEPSDSRRLPNRTPYVGVPPDQRAGQDPLASHLSRLFATPPRADAKPNREDDR